jgi:predicted Zn-dependent protease
MGYCQYIVIPKLKILIEISRYIREDDLPLIEEDLTLINLMHEELQRYTGEEKSFRNVTMEELSKKIVLSDKTLSLISLFDYYMMEYMFLLFLNEYEIEWRIITEYELYDESDKENYGLNKKYYVIRRK